MLAINELAEFVEVDEPRFITLSPVNVRRVKSELRRIDARAKQTERRCQYCGNPIDPGKRSIAKYCSDYCAKKHNYEVKRRIIGKPVKDGAERRCKWCGAAIDQRKKAGAKYCSKKCYMRDYNAHKRKKVDA